MADLKVYNSLTRQKEVFAPLTPGHVGMYVCGPTVSGESHLGHARPNITFDVVFRYLRHLGYAVRYVRNITDAGHFEEEGREAEDKISKKAVLERLEPMELVQKYTNLFHWAMHRFNNLDPTIEPTATGHIVEQIEMIKRIIKDGYAYEVNGSVYFDVEKYNRDYSKKGQPYGILSGRTVEDQVEGGRELDNQAEKRNKVDFALWKKAPPEHIMRWPSPWGEGFPGWHIECSAMSTKYLGTRFDIHGGGMDLLFPHHECEIAQSTVCNHRMPARYWLHNNMITINGKKMGKSYNNQIRLTEMFTGSHPLLEQAYSPMTIRFFILQTHYRSTLDFGNEALKGSEKGLRRLWEAYDALRHMEPAEWPEAASEPTRQEARVLMLLADMDESMNDDFNTAKVLANLFELVPVINGLRDGHISGADLGPRVLAMLHRYFKTYLEDILGLVDEHAGDNRELLDGVLQLLIQLRKDARTGKDYATSDRIRNQLLELGVALKDEKDGGVSFTFS